MEVSVGLLHDYDSLGSWPPWSALPSLREMTTELGISFDDLIKDFAQGTSDTDIAQKHGISTETASQLNEHFFRYGLNSVVAGD